MALYEGEDGDLPRGDEKDYDHEAPGVVAIPGMGGQAMGTGGAGVAGFPIGRLTDVGETGGDADADHNVTDSPDSFAGGGATSPGRDANADVLDR